MKTDPLPYNHRTGFQTSIIQLKPMMTAILIALPISAEGVTTISTCPYEITTPGRYLVAKDLTCNGTALSIWASDVDLHLGNRTISGNGTGAGIAVGDGANVTIHHGTIQGFDIGIGLWNTLNNDLNHLTIIQNQSAGIAGVEAFNTSVTDNTVDRNGWEGISFGPNAPANTIARNTASLNGGSGIRVFGSSYGNTITHNTVNENLYGIRVLDSCGNTISRNQADHNGAVAIEVVGPGSDGNIIQSNMVRASESDGIRLLTATQNMVRDNTCVGHYIGIRIIEGSTHNTVLRNKVDSNTIGILMYDNVTVNRIVDNVVKDSMWGMWLGTIATGNTIRNNKVLDSSGVDLVEENTDCPNSWVNNEFQTTDGSGAQCIH